MRYRGNIKNNANNINVAKKRKNFNVIAHKGMGCLLTLCILLLALSGCGDDENSGPGILVEHTEGNNIAVEKIAGDGSAEEDIVPTDNSGELTNEDDMEAQEEDDEVEEGELFNPAEATSYLDKTTCKVDTDSGEIKYSLTFKGDIPKSDDQEIYLFEISTYENEDSISGKEPLANKKKAKEMDFAVDYHGRYLFSRFIPAILHEGKYIPMAKGLYISNPGSIASNSKAYPKVGSKKGILIDGRTLGDEKFTSMNVKRVVYNIPLSLIVGETTDPNNPTFNYDYNGTTYHFNGAYVKIYDILFTKLTQEGCHCAAIILNDWNDNYMEMIHPKSRSKTAQSLYYAFNTEDEEGVRLLEATALFLAERYTTGEHGMVYDWIIANEVNQHKIWNYMDTNDLGYYSQSFEKSFRTFYYAIKSKYSNANVSFSIDHDWNDNDGDNSKFFNGRDFMYKFNEAAKAHGNYDWGLSIHPYPDPLPKVEYWKGNFDKSETARVMTPMNLSCLTKLMAKDEFRDTSGKVRNIGVTELGFSSSQGDALQGAAIAYCYLIIENNEYISSFLMNRQTDSEEEMKSGMALGIYTTGLEPKPTRDIFAIMDTDKRDDYIPQMLEIIGASSLEEALSWAK